MIEIPGYTLRIINNSPALLSLLYDLDLPGVLAAAAGMTGLHQGGVSRP